MEASLAVIAENSDRFPKKMKTTAESSLEVLKDLLPILEAQDDYSNDGLYQIGRASCRERV